MTIYIAEKSVNNHSISIRQEKFEDVFRVRDIEIGCKAPDSDLIYPTLEKAKRRFNTLCRKYKEV